MFRTFLFCLLSSLALCGAEIRIVEWKTEYASPPADLPKEQEALFSLIRMGIAVVPEPAVMQFTFFGATTLGLSADKAEELHALLSQRYLEIAKDPLFSKIPSALPYSFSKKKPDKGLSWVYVPEGATSKTPVVLFLHGYGGSFIYYLHYFATAFPDRIIICPAYGISTWKIPSQYLEQALEHTSIDLGFKVAKPTLIGLSAGGFGGFREYFRNYENYLGYICLAAYPPEDLAVRKLHNGRAVVIAGANEPFVQKGYLQRTRLKRYLNEYAVYTIAGREHFFLLTAERETVAILSDWLDRFEGE